MPSTKAVNWPIEAAVQSPAQAHAACERAAQIRGRRPWEGGNKVKEREKEIHRGKPVHHWNLHVVDTDMYAWAKTGVQRCQYLSDVLAQDT